MGKPSLRLQSVSHAWPSLGLSQACVTLLLIFPAILSGCFLNGKTPKKTATSESTEDLETPIQPIPSKLLLHLDAVLLSKTSPTDTFDLIGHGGEMGTVCGNFATGDAGASSPCRCRYEYRISLPDGSVNPELVEFNPIYSEANLLRCNHAIAGTNLVRVTITHTLSDKVSNSVPFTFYSETTLDLKDPNFFTSVQRYQCRDLPYIPYSMDNSVYDPIQSRDPRNLIPLDFYTSSMGTAFVLFSQQNLKSWDCQPPPLPGLSGAEAGVRFRTEMRVFSNQSLDGDPNGSVIYPVPAGAAAAGTDRYHFLLARAPSIVFNFPLSASIAPGVSGFTGQPDLDKSRTLGYAAQPRVIRSGQTGCPTSSQVQIPPTFRWRKLWVFHASTINRTYVQGKNLGVNSSVSCSPGKSLQNANGATPTEKPIFEDCDVNWVSNQTVGVNSSSDLLAARIIGNSTSSRRPNCVLVSTTNGSATNCSGSNPGPGCVTNNSSYNSLFAPGADIWQLRNGSSTGNGSCRLTNDDDPSKSVFDDIFKLCQDNRPDAAPTTLSIGVPHDRDIEGSDSNISSLPINLDSEDGKFLFVTTPEEIEIDDFDSGNSTGEKYTPFRYRSPGDCPDEAHDSDACKARRINYGLYIPENTSSSVFPLCVLQSTNDTPSDIPGGAP